jgi:two-component system NtrC family response regulator
LKIAIVEDDINVRKSLEIAMADYSQFAVDTFKNPTDALKKLDDSYDLVITDLNMPKMDGMEFIKKLDGKYDVIIITGNATLQRAVDSIKFGVKDFLIKPFQIEKLVEAIYRAKSSSSNETTKKIREEKSSEKRRAIKRVERPKFIGSSSALDKVLNFANRSAKTDASVLLLGESGVGKELFARYIHNNSGREKKSFVAINMASIPENLLESELFGYEKGAFTDAVAMKEGQFELANGGTIFFDEIGEMPYQLQAKLLRAIQEREIIRLGGKKQISIDVRIISATNANIGEKILSGDFRKDLYYRLNTIPIQIPPLRERRDEILEIAEKSLEDFCSKYSFKKKSFSEETKRVLKNHYWSGNVRELLSVVERATILTEGETIEPDNLLLEEIESGELQRVEKELLEKVLEKFRFDKKESAKYLGYSLTGFEKRLREFGIGY